MTNSTRGMMDITVVNIETGERATYTCMDLQCAQMLAAEDHGGDPEDWVTPRQLAAEEQTEDE